VGLERGSLSLVSITEKLLERKSSVSGLESREYGRRYPSRCPRCTLYPQKLALTSPTSGCRSVGIVRSRTQATEFSFFLGGSASSCLSYISYSKDAYLKSHTIRLSSILEIVML
jgi:hypothetical protein